jgi:hypothetical protein
MSAADWYPDPTRPGRLRYWDGSMWTQHVSENGEVAVEPVEGIAPAPPRADSAVPPPAPPAGAAATTVDDPAAPAPSTGGPTAGFGALFASGGPGGPTMLGRIGFILAAIGGVLSALSSGKVAVEQTEPFPATITVGGGAWIGIVVAVVAVAGALSPWLLGRVSAAVITWLGGAFISFAVIGFRTDEIFSSSGDLSLGTAGVLMVMGALLMFAGTAIALWGIRVPVTEPDPAAVANPREGKGIASLVSGIVGILILVASPAAVALGLVALDDDRASDGKVGSRRMAKTGIVLGVVGMAVWGIGLTLAMFLAKP